MLNNESLVKIADNTWAKTWKIIRVLKGSKPGAARIGDKVVIAVKTAATGWIVGKSDVSWAVIVRARKEIGRNDGSYIRFWDNAVVLIDKDGNPKGKRIFWPVGKEVRERGFLKVATLADEII